MCAEREHYHGQNSSSSLQLIHGREYLETYYSDITKFQQDLEVAIMNDIEEVIDVASSFDELANQVSTLIKLLELRDFELSLPKSQQPLHGLRRILELSFASSSQLEELADHACWGKPIGKQIEQFERNLFPLKQLLGDTVSWLDQVIDRPPDLGTTSP